MVEISNELIANLIMEMNGKLGQRLQNMESFLLAMAQHIEKTTKEFEIQRNITIHQLGKMLATATSAKEKISDLSEVEFSATSPADEDGIIEWLVAHLKISARRFVEIGAGNFKQGICRFLAGHRGWKGLLLDPDGNMLWGARLDDFYRRHNLNAFEALVTRESIDHYIEINEMGGPLGLLSINAGGIEYWVWSGLIVSRPDIVVCAFNPVFGDRYAITVPYNPNFAPLEMHPSNYYRGASIAALNLLAKEKNYVFVGTNTKGTNAFFVRAEIAGDVLPLIERPRAFPARARNPEDKHEELESVGGISRLGLIKDLPVLDLASGKTLKLSELDRPYSEDWQRGMN